MPENINVSVLNSVYRGALTGRDAISDLLPSTKDPTFISDLKAQQMQYVSICNEAAAKLRSMGAVPEDPSVIQKTGMKLGTKMNTMMNNETDHLAELMIKGSNMGIVNMTKVLNGYPSVSNDVKGLAQQLITTEQNNIERLKNYLK